MEVTVNSTLGARAKIERYAEATRYLVPIGRLFFVAILLLSVPHHFQQAGIGYAAQQGVPLASVLVPIAGLMALAGGLSVLLGYHARFGALLLARFLLPVTLAMHRFWTISDPMQAQIQQIMFLKNLALIGSTLVMMHLGAGPISLDERSSR